MSKGMTLEQTLDRLEEIAEKMAGELTIDESIKLYTEAVKLIQQADSKLEAAKLKVEKLSAPKEDPDEPL